MHILHSINSKHTKEKIILLFIISITIFLGFPVSAANDDPGTGRLSGRHISSDFYDDNILPLTRYGDGEGAVANPYTGQAYTHQAVFADRIAIVNGIDVSQWQGSKVDWNKVKAAGIDFAFIRVGYRGYGDSGTLNESTKDSCFDLNMQNASAAGVSTGIYIFSQAITEEEAVEEANYILEHIGGYSVTMPLIIDYEYAENGKTGRLYKANLSREAATNVCLAFCRTIAEAGYTPMVYANKSMLTDQLNAATITSLGYRVWLANYTTATDYAGSFDFWQYSSQGKVDGIFKIDANGNPQLTDVDMNFYYAQATDNFMPIANSIALGSVDPIPDQIYTGAAITPAVTVTYNGAVLVPGQDYVVTYTDNVEPGTAYVKITGQGAYQGVKTVSFNITLNQITGFGAKKVSTNYITTGWDPCAGVTGYELYRATAIDGNYTLIKTITGSQTTSYKDTKLNAGQCYYYKIRAYISEPSGPVYGADSPVASICTKASYKRNALAKSGATIYDAASYAGTPTANPPKNTALPVSYYTNDANGNGWYCVSYTTDYDTIWGFVPASNVTIARVGKIVKTKKVNVRKSSTVNSKKLTTLKKNKKVNVLSTKKKYGVTWYKVRFKKNEKTYNGWISAPYVKIQ